MARTHPLTRLHGGFMPQHHKRTRRHLAVPIQIRFHFYRPIIMFFCSSISMCMRDMSWPRMHTPHVFTRHERVHAKGPDLSARPLGASVGQLVFRDVVRS